MAKKKTKKKTTITINTAVIEQQMQDLSELLRKRDKEIEALRDENDKFRMAQHYGNFR